MFNKPKSWKDWGVLLTAWLSILALGLNGMFQVDITPFVGDIANFFLLTIFIAVSAWGVWKNTFVSPKAKEQKKVLQEKGLIKK
ncbi:phage holin [Rossellomorea vietnamensis]|uniref:phage holin n=1 Tax=Rossellomorea vietnamensis TaxID=218284 RepID=UPI003CF12E60